jgi:hypothetical protein
MKIICLLAARRAASIIIESSVSERRDDEAGFFDLDFSSSSSSLSFSDSDDECTVLDFIMSLQRSSSTSPHLPIVPQKFCPSEPPARADNLPSQQHGDRKRGIGTMRTLSFDARKAVPRYDGGSHSFARSSSRRRSFARSTYASAQSLRLFLNAPPHATEDGEHHAAEQTCRRAPSCNVIRRCLAKFSRRLRTAASPRVAEARGLRRMRKCRSALSATPRPSSLARRDDSAVEKQDSIADAIAHCKESLHRASTSDCESPMLRSRSDLGKGEAA